MKSVMFIALLPLLLTARLLEQPKASSQVNQTQLWFTEQLLDHSDPANQQQWSQRYWVIEDYFKAQSNTTKQLKSVLLYICGEYTCPGIPEARHFPLVIAERYNSLVLVLEHRFYGQSMPLGNDSMKVESLKYLSVHQALDDLAYFIHWVVSTQQFGVQEYMPWYTIGGSYPGALSAWFRYKYPHLTIGALASSAVVNAILDFPEFDGQIRESTLLSGDDCTTSIQNLTFIAEQQLGNETTSQEFKARFNSENLNEGEFLFMFADVFVELVQYGKRTGLCDLLSGKSLEDQMEEVAKYTRENVDVTAYGSYYLKNDTYNPQNAGSRQWTYQTCSEVGFFQTAPSDNSASLRSRKLDLNFYRQWCKDSFGVDLWPDTNRTNTYFGGVHLDVENLVMTNGVEDPWRHASITNEKRKGDIVVRQSDCVNCAHCVELYTPNELDSKELKQTRKLILWNFNQWFKQYWKRTMNEKKEEKEWKKEKDHKWKKEKQGKKERHGKKDKEWRKRDESSEDGEWKQEQIDEWKKEGNQKREWKKNGQWKKESEWKKGGEWKQDHQWKQDVEQNEDDQKMKNENWKKSKWNQEGNWEQGQWKKKLELEKIEDFLNEIKEISENDVLETVEVSQENQSLE